MGVFGVLSSLHLMTSWKTPHLLLRGICNMPKQHAAGSPDTDRVPGISWSAPIICVVVDENESGDTHLVSAAVCQAPATSLTYIVSSSPRYPATQALSQSLLYRRSSQGSERLDHASKILEANLHKNEAASSATCSYVQWPLPGCHSMSQVAPVFNCYSPQPVNSSAGLTVNHSPFQVLCSTKAFLSLASPLVVLSQSSLLAFSSMSASKC